MVCQCVRTSFSLYTDQYVIFFADSNKIELDINDQFLLSLSEAKNTSVDTFSTKISKCIHCLLQLMQRLQQMLLDFLNS